MFAAARGAQVVVDDVGCGADGSGTDPSLAVAVADEIGESGGSALARTDDVRRLAGAQALLDTAVDAFGVVHSLVNNAGILRDRMFVDVHDEAWDDVVEGQLKSTFCTRRGRWPGTGGTGRKPGSRWPRRW